MENKNTNDKKKFPDSPSSITNCFPDSNNNKHVILVIHCTNSM